jgi:hypothetical protein
MLESIAATLPSPRPAAAKQSGVGFLPGHPATTNADAVSPCASAFSSLRFLRHDGLGDLEHVELASIVAEHTGSDQAAAAAGA